MQFFTHKRSLPAVPLISLIDILAILLIFFIATTTFKKQESLVKINLPKSSEMENSSDTSMRTVLSLTGEKEIFLADQLIPIENLSEALRQLKAADPEGKLELKADQKAEIGLLVKIWDAAKKAGVEIDKLPLRILIDNSQN